LFELRRIFLDMPRDYGVQPSREIVQRVRDAIDSQGLEALATKTLLHPDTLKTFVVGGRCQAQTLARVTMWRDAEEEAQRELEALRSIRG
jgi:hypothetical protein